MRTRPYAALISVGVLGGAISSTVLAQSDESSKPAELIEEVLVTGQLSSFGATKSTLPILETARSISIETEQMIRDKGALTLDDSLAYISGVVGETFGFSTRQDFAKVRGFDAAEYRDGQQVLFGNYNNTRSDIYMLEQVEVLKGPASVLYGKGTPGGIVNAISKTAGANTDNEIVVDFGNHDRKQLAGDYNISFSDALHARVVGLVRDSGTQIDEIDDQAQMIMPSITYTTDRASISALVEYVNRETDSAHQFLPIQSTGCKNGDAQASEVTGPLAAFGPLCARPTDGESDLNDYHGHPDFNEYNSESTLASLLGSYRVSDALSFDSVLRYKKANVDYRQAWVTFAGAIARVSTGGESDGTGVRTYAWSQRDTEQFAADLRLRWEVSTGALEHEIFAGISWQDVETGNDERTERGIEAFNIFTLENGAVPEAFQSFQPNDFELIHTEEHGIYLNDQVSIDRLKINLGLRYDDTRTSVDGSNSLDAISDYNLAISGGLLYAFDSGISPYISYAESFEPVIAVDDVRGRAKLPREGEQIELGIKYQPQGTRTYFTLAYFDIEENNQDEAGLDPNQSTQGDGKATSQGFELEAMSSFGDFSIELNLTLMDTETADGWAFNYIPEKLASAWFSYKPRSGTLLGFKSGLGVRYVGSSEDNYDASAFGLGVVSVETQDYTVYDAMLGYELDNWDFTLNLRNLSNEEYYSSCLVRGDCFPGEERSVVARMAYKF